MSTERISSSIAAPQTAIFARLPALAAEIVKNRPDVIVALVSAPALAAKDATSTIPIVMVGVSDPVASGLVGNLARPAAT